MQHLPIGSTLQGGKFKIERVLGQGGFGITYLAVHPLMSYVTVKEYYLKDYFNRDEETYHVTCATDSQKEMAQTYRRKFIKEAQTLHKLKHPNLVEIYDIFEENDTAYYAMEYIDGESLLDMVKRRGSIPEAEAVGYILKVAEALAFIHEHHVTHLDVKPGNILVSRVDGTVKLIDFGAAKHYDGETGTQTTIATPCYSPGYAPFEQYKHGGVALFSPESDIYALGATLYKLLSGKTPPEPSEILTEGLPPLPAHISENVKNAIEKAMQLKPADRPRTVAAFVDLLTVKGIDVDDEQTEIVPPAPRVTPPPTPRVTPRPTSPQTPPPPPANDSTSSNGWLVFVAMCVVTAIACFLFARGCGGTVEVPFDDYSDSCVVESVEWFADSIALDWADSCVADSVAW